MGRARILSLVDESQYSVELMPNNERVETQKARNEKLLTEAQKNLTDSDAKLRDLKLERATIAAALDVLLDEWEEDGLDSPDLSKLLLLHNIKRAERGLDAFVPVAALHSAAQGHASWLRQNESASHTGQGGSNPGQRIKDAGYDWTDEGGSAENVAVGAYKNQQVFDGWMASPGHAANILNSSLTHIGLGYSQDNSTTYRRYWCVTFGYLKPGKPFTVAEPGDVEIIARDSDAPPEIEEELKKMRAVATRIELEETYNAAFKNQVKDLTAAIAKAAEILSRSVTKTAWIADYSQELEAGQVVGTIETAQEGSDVVIFPDYIEGADWSASRDGILSYRDAQTPEQVFFNAAVLPGWQKFKPTYRVGTIDAIDLENDKCSVTLEPATSSAQGLNILKETSLTDVPMFYMTCNAGGFEEGDRVIVQFEGQNWENPKVIGFPTEPRQCPGVILNGACDFATNRSFIAAYFTDNDVAFDIWANPGSYTISLAGVVLTNTDPGEWTQRIGGVVKRRVMVYKAPHMIPCGKGGLLAVTDLDGGTWSVKIQKGDEVILDMNLIGSPVREPAEDLIYSAFCEASPFRAGTTVQLSGKGFGKQKYQTYFTIT